MPPGLIINFTTNCNSKEENSYDDTSGIGLPGEHIFSTSTSSQIEPITQLLYDESVHLSRE